MMKEKTCTRSACLVGFTHVLKSAFGQFASVCFTRLMMHFQSACATTPSLVLPKLCFPSTGKYFSEALILASVNPQYDNRLFIDLRLQYEKNTSSEHVV